MLNLDKWKYPDAAKTENPVTSVGRVEEAKRMWNDLMWFSVRSEKQIGLALSMTILRFFLMGKVKRKWELEPWMESTCIILWKYTGSGWAENFWEGPGIRIKRKLVRWEREFGVACSEISAAGFSRSPVLTVSVEGIHDIGELDKQMNPSFCSTELTWGCASVRAVPGGRLRGRATPLNILLIFLLWYSLCQAQPGFSSYSDLPVLYPSKGWDLFCKFGEGNGNPLQHSCLENLMDGGAWWAAVCAVAKSQTRLNDFTFTFNFHALEKEMATHSSVLAWRIPGTGEPWWDRKSVV